MMRSRLSETATNSSPVSAPAALPEITAKLSQTPTVIAPSVTGVPGQHRPAPPRSPFRESRRVHAITQPPLTSIVWPVTKEESGPARNATTAASSSGAPRRFSAWWSRTNWL